MYSKSNCSKYDFMLICLEFYMPGENKKMINPVHCQKTESHQKLQQSYAAASAKEKFAMLLLAAGETYKIYHQSPMQTEKSQPEGKWIMSEKRFTKFAALSIDPRVGISLSDSLHETLSDRLT